MIEPGPNFTKCCVCTFTPVGNIYRYYDESKYINIHPFGIILVTLRLDEHNIVFNTFNIGILPVYGTLTQASAAKSYS